MKSEKQNSKLFKGLGIFFSISLIPLGFNLFYKGYPQFLPLITMVLIISIVVFIFLCAGPLNHWVTTVRLNRISLFPKLIFVVLTLGLNGACNRKISNNDYTEYLEYSNFKWASGHLVHPLYYQSNSKGEDKLSFEVREYPDFEFVIDFAEWVDRNKDIDNPKSGNVVDFQVTKRNYEAFLSKEESLTLWEKMNYPKSIQTVSFVNKDYTLLSLEDVYELNIEDNRDFGPILKWISWTVVILACISFCSIELRYLAIRFKLPFISSITRTLYKDRKRN